MASTVVRSLRVASVGFPSVNRYAQVGPVVFLGTLHSTKNLRKNNRPNDTTRRKLQSVSHLSADVSKNTHCLGANYTVDGEDPILKPDDEVCTCNHCISVKMLIERCHFSFVVVLRVLKSPVIPLFR